MKSVLLKLVGFYKRWISPLFPPACRFHPTCSDYAADALKEWGVFRGLLLTCRRLLKCHPFHPGGFDYVPANIERRKK